MLTTTRRKRAGFGAALLALSAWSAGCAGFGSTTRPAFDLQGHRGARALWPENTIQGFLGALDLGVTTLELDVVVSADREVVVSHEPWFSARFSSLPTGRAVDEAREREYSIYAMPYAEVRRFDVGRRGHPGFPRQQAMPAFKPTLGEVFASSDRHARAVGRALPRFNVEIKSRPEWDGKLTPPVDEFVALVVAAIERAGVAERANVQSFDVRALRATRALAPRLELALLVDESDQSDPRDVDGALERLGFTPEIYSPAHAAVDAALVARCRALGLRVIPWTVNDGARMAELADLGVDGLITDSPDVALGLRR